MTAKEETEQNTTAQEAALVIGSKNDSASKDRRK